MELKLFFHDNGTDIFVGNIFIENNSKNEVYSFSFDSAFLKEKRYFNFDPEIEPFLGRQFSQKGVFGFIEDILPDRFGRLLLDEQEKEKASKENRLPKKLKTSDYLIGVNDLTRMGAFRISIDDRFVSDNIDEAVPPYIYLREVENAWLSFEKDGEFSNEQVKRLLLPGSSLGGARPKANVYYNDELYIAKFPSNKDEYDVECWEKISLVLAEMCGISTPINKLERYSKAGSTLLIKRFDREKEKRIHYLSFMTALGAEDGNNDNFTYLDLVGVIKQLCHNIDTQLFELYRRIIFTFLFNNVDNHLRNHGLIYKDGYFELSPVFDVNPFFFSSSFALTVDGEISKESIIENHKYFGLTSDKASQIFNQIKEIIANNLSNVAKKYGASDREVKFLLNRIQTL